MSLVADRSTDFWPLERVDNDERTLDIGSPR